MDKQKIIENFINIINKLDFSNDIILPSEYAEKNRKLTSDVSTVQGKFRYSLTPYFREIIDTLSPYHPAKIVAIMKGAQIGFTEGILVNGILWIIANNPGNIMALSANDDLSREMIESRLDQGISSCNIRHLIRPNTIRKKNQRTGDTSKYKEFAGGRLFAGSVQAIDKLGKQRSLTYGFFDDWDSAPVSDKKQGSLFNLIQQRFSTSANIMKQYYAGTPETRPSNIENVYLKGDQRKWHVPCPKCGTYIQILWHEVINEKKCGVTWETDENGKVIEETVGYTCQACGDFFDESYKYDINLEGKWIPTAEPIQPGYYSYYVPALIAAPNMYDWTHYAHQFNDIKQSIGKLKVFKNVVLGEPWEEIVTDIESNKLALNTRNYEVYQIPSELSKKDGNEEIILLTCAADLNGTVDDARLDYEVVGHSVSGSTYSIDHGSIGTFQKGLKKEGRICWTYRNEKELNVWDYLWKEIITRIYYRDDNTPMKIAFVGIDTGYYTHFAYHFIDEHPGLVIGLKGGSETEKKPTRISKDLPLFRLAKERNNLYILETDKIKDNLSEKINLQWNQNTEEYQPAGFMNFPIPSDGKYTANGFFKHYESEHKVLSQNDDGEITGWVWELKTGMQNHFFDCAVYNYALRDICAMLVCKDYKIRNGKWSDFIEIIKKTL